MPEFLARISAYILYVGKYFIMNKKNQSNFLGIDIIGRSATSGLQFSKKDPEGEHLKTH